MVGGLDVDASRYNDMLLVGETIRQKQVTAVSYMYRYDEVCSGRWLILCPNEVEL